ncbi:MULTISPECIES: bifunctional 2-polyprenyl-6-hydroxyphenol methylase/3-demethylubiquinol 3-O-methyltransferase UbiG [unclassified Serratia (in: enterobacteria)]|uniref:class I SAM-dependent methyltransferase n=1 Tax=unclassified Serratia (in: enterobacteria) TaxID=2647522 RepID=UPI000508C08F|nr:MULTISPECIES: class I SAM-dependent methyltransferase [unclassified Serratia (in: enterobacteria)]KFK94953.1 hypothetical protein JV45_10010 [Serratia sp. Ag2]KFK96984.1 hypothetical protein IV04_16880 [Serratia sp. Ag1]
MSYSSITFLDKNPIKRALQRKRLVIALSSYTPSDSERIMHVCDFGSGNGELLKLVPEGNTLLTCYEPSPELIEQAKENLSNVKNVSFTQDVNSIPSSSMDYVFCLEVFEHLPNNETIEALRDITRILKNDGKLIIGVPVEIGFPAIYKGLFRLTRRRNTFDTKISHIISATLKNPPKNRPVGKITSNFNFHFDHMGFDYRVLKLSLKEHFHISRIFYSPYNLMSCFMPEVYFEVSLKK